MTDSNEKLKVSTDTKQTVYRGIRGPLVNGWELMERRMSITSLYRTRFSPSRRPPSMNLDNGRQINATVDYAAS